MLHIPASSPHQHLSAGAIAQMTSLSLAEVRDLLHSGTSAAAVADDHSGGSSCGHVLQRVEDLLQQLEEDLGSMGGANTDLNSNSGGGSGRRGGWGASGGGDTGIDVCDQTPRGKGSGGGVAEILSVLMGIARAEVTHSLFVLGLSLDE